MGVIPWGVAENRGFVPLSTDRYWHLYTVPQTGTQGGAKMDRRRWLWLVEQTGEDKIRAIARECGVSHTTVQRWLSKGIPMSTLTDLMFRFQADPVEACVAWGFLQAEHVACLNWGAVIQYVPFEVLRDEIHRRELEYGTDWEDHLRKGFDPESAGAFGGRSR